jgi:glycine/D-amino acid oxidase-like deaminating enzyme
MDRPFDVAIIGAGIMGAATAATLAQAGLRIVVFEQYKIGHIHGRY